MAFTDDAQRKLDRGFSEAKRTGRRAARNVRVGARDLQDDAASEARALLDRLDKSLRDNSDVDVAALRKRLQAQLNDARGSFGDAADSTVDQVRETVAMAAEFARERPWQAIGVVAGVAFLVGALVGRK
ncbi:YqjD family protein [Paraburkholderia sp. DHOC27]|uniref:DUF883 family protein n=1 Tax=Paraburkholderia sp. DHOC27 TaxID=2303330 RepID=UPI000E3E3869|nr:DUF883 family protein [Paraburkholderia sp. DHOC27]RFU46508.1 DUF883 domain-containing protein [Paraburkholderia sp. DHOC27]